MPKVLRSILMYSVTAILLLFGTTMVQAQSTGAINGIVLDSSKAAIPDATVTITNPDTGLTRSVHTNSTGLFAFPNVPIGAYTMQISKPGFETQKRTAQQLLTGQTMDLSIALAIGSNVETVDVTTETQQIKTSTSEVSTTVDQKQMADLPLNQRNPIQLTALTPGVVLTTVGTEGAQQDNTGIAVNGLRPTQNNFQLDGVVYMNRFFDSVPTMPNPDALQEFTIQATNYSAAYAGAGALVQLSTRSGTNQLHGSAFEFFRNTVLDARPYFTRAPNKNPPYKLNQFGGTVGGPIVIPHLYNGRDKTFFFFSAEDLQRRASPTSYTIYLPTAAQLSGDFSAFFPDSGGNCPASSAGLAKSACKQIYDPITHVAFPGNIISTPINTLSKNVANQYTTPLLGSADPVSGKYVALTNSNIDSTQYLVKIDHQFSQHDHFSGRYFYNENNYQRPFTGPLGFFAANLFRNQNLALSDTHIFSSTLTATLALSAGRYARTQIPEAPGRKTTQELGATGVPLGTNVPIFPGVRSNISGYVNIFSGGALTQVPTTYEVRAQGTKLLGHHTFSFGASYEWGQINATDYSYTPGDNTFNGSRTQNTAGVGGNPVADFYFGYNSNFFQDNGRKFYLREKRPSAFLQDDWKIGRDLTVNLGVRWDPWLPPTDNNGSLVGFKAGQQSTIAPGAPTGLLFNGDQGTVPAVFHNNYKDFAPRVGFAYNVAGRGDTVVRGAFGLFYGFPEGLLYQRTNATQPVDLYYQISAPTATWDVVYNGVPGGNPFPRAHVGPDQFKNYTFITPVSGGALNPNSHVAYTEAYNLSLSQKLPGNFAFEIGYVGNHALHVMGSRQFNPAVCAAGAPCPTLDNSTCATCTIGNENTRRLYPGIGAMELADSYEYAIYNSLQTTLTHRVSRGLTLIANFVWAKVIDNGSAGSEGTAGPSNPFNFNTTRGPADYDQRIRS
ncbi:MAG: carboxypeptidase regulatory-like domain-containing protein, partial [Bryocella sp.]